MVNICKIFCKYDEDEAIELSDLDIHQVSKNDGSELENMELYNTRTFFGGGLKTIDLV